MSQNSRRCPLFRIDGPSRRMGETDLPTVKVEGQVLQGQGKDVGVLTILYRQRLKRFRRTRFSHWSHEWFVHLSRWKCHHSLWHLLWPMGLRQQPQWWRIWSYQRVSVENPPYFPSPKHDNVRCRYIRWHLINYWWGKYVSKSDITFAYLPRAIWQNMRTLEFPSITRLGWSSELSSSDPRGKSYGVTVSNGPLLSIHGHSVTLKTIPAEDHIPCARSCVPEETTWESNTWVALAVLGDERTDQPW